nr:hypothetical protein [uncultured Dethiosulfovibrio sp.]
MNRRDALIGIIELLIRFHPEGIPILLGDVARPLGLGWLPLLEGARGDDDLGVKICKDPSISQLLDQVGQVDEIDRVLEGIGWKNVVEATRAVRSFSPLDWDMFVLHLSFVTDYSRLGDKSPLQAIADKCGVSPKTVSRRRQEIPEQIARLASMRFQQALHW